jgi:putative copper export protein
VYLYLVLKAVHILSAAIWFGAGLPVSGDVRRTIERGRPHTDLLPDRVNRLGRVGLIAGVFTLGTGLGLIFHMGGFANVRPNIHAGLGLTLLLFAVGVGLTLPAWRRIEAALTAEGGDLAEARRLARRLAMFQGIEHLLWVVTLVLMVFRF